MIVVAMVELEGLSVLIVFMLVFLEGLIMDFKNSLRQICLFRIRIR
ncbi:hypothetical protein BAL199_17528 [alpha proteobacterium BAL199]|nr:hypothetical protein BAL199_17528 [alpha proteobacterium BAL199]